MNVVPRRRLVKNAYMVPLVYCTQLNALLWKAAIFLSGGVSVKKDAAPPLAADAIRMNRRKRGVAGASRLTKAHES